MLPPDELDQIQVTATAKATCGKTQCQDVTKLFAEPRKTIRRDGPAPLPNRLDQKEYCYTKLVKRLVAKSVPKFVFNSLQNLEWNRRFHTFDRL